MVEQERCQSLSKHTKAGCPAGPSRNQGLGDRMTLNRWMTAGAAVVGRAHEQQGAGCQDCVGYSDTSKFSAVALADGAGSAKYASEGAGIAVNVLLRIIERSFSSFSQQPSDSIGKLIISSMADGIESAAQTAGVAPREFASTLLFAATGGGFLIAGQLGDGLIAVQKNGRMVPLCEPAKGEFKNETVFVTSPNAAKHIFVTLGPCDAVAGIVLMSDGSADSLFHNESRTFAQAVNNMAGWLDRHTPADVSKALRENLWNVIRNRPGITDDCSIAVLRRVSIEVEDLAQRA